MAVWMIVALAAAMAGLESASYGFSGAAQDLEVLLVLVLLALIPAGIALAPGPPTRAAAGLGVGGQSRLRIPAGLAPAAAAVALVLLWLEPRPQPVPDEEESPLTLILRKERLRRPLVTGTPPVHLGLSVATDGPQPPIEVDPEWGAPPPGGTAGDGPVSFAPAMPVVSAETVWIKVAEASWPLRFPPDRLEVAESTPASELARLRREFNPAAGAMNITQNERGLSLGWLAPATRPPPPWKFRAPSEGYVTAGGKSWTGGPDGWPRSAPRDNYVAGYFVADKQRPAISPAWDASDPSLAFGILGHRVAYAFNFGMPMTEVHVLSPLISVATVGGLPEPYLVRFEGTNWWRPRVQPDVLPDLEAPRQARDLLDDLIFSRRSRQDAAAPGFLVPVRPTEERPVHAFDLASVRRLPAADSEVRRLRADVVRIGLVVACGACLWMSFLRWGRRQGV
jgi:hypothetical protein